LPSFLVSPSYFWIARKKVVMYMIEATDVFFDRSVYRQSTVFGFAQERI
jgi:hypothetical protein